MSNQTVKLSASARFGFGGKQFVARITGRHPKFTFEYEFLGRKEGKCGEDTSFVTDESGLYVERDVDSKGRVDDTTYLVWLDGDRLRKISVERSEAMRIAKGPLDAATIAREGRADLAQWLRGQLEESKLEDGESFVVPTNLIIGLEKGAATTAGAWRAALAAEIGRLAPTAPAAPAPDARAQAILQIKELMNQHGITTLELE